MINHQLSQMGNQIIVVNLLYRFIKNDYDTKTIHIRK